MSSDSGDDNPQFEKEVKEFGNGGHVTLPKEFVGETVTISTVDADEDQPREIQPPVTMEKIESVLEDATGSDFRSVTREEDIFPQECQLQYRHDLRLAIDVDLVEEGSAPPSHEEGTIVYFIWEITEEELDQYAPWFDKSEDEKSFEFIYAVEPAVDDLFDHPKVVCRDLYKYRVMWDGREIYSVEFSHRSTKNGRFYFPVWGRYSSLSEYRSSTAYALATAISSAPQEDYDRYLEAAKLDETVWGEKDLPLDFDREHVMESTVLYAP
jgi:hypothetical protein